MKWLKFSEEQIVYALRQAETGTPVGDLCRQLVLCSTQIVDRWVSQLDAGNPLNSFKTSLS